MTGARPTPVRPVLGRADAGGLSPRLNRVNPRISPNLQRPGWHRVGSPPRKPPARLAVPRPAGCPFLEPRACLPEARVHLQPSPAQLRPRVFQLPGGQAGPSRPQQPNDTPMPATRECADRPPRQRLPHHAPTSSPRPGPVPCPSTRAGTFPGRGGSAGGAGLEAPQSSPHAGESAPAEQLLRPHREASAMVSPSPHPKGPSTPTGPWGQPGPSAHTNQGWAWGN